MRLEFATAGRIVFGPGAAAELGPAVARSGRRVFVVTGRNASRVDALLGGLRSQGVEVMSFSVPGEPTVSLVQDAVDRLRGFGAECVVGVGGGSALDAAKAAAALAAAPGTVTDYLEVVGKGLPLASPALPLVAVPTTAGTGAEVTRNAVLSVPERSVKVSLRGPSLLPSLALVDPDLAQGLPPRITAETGMDALTQVIEAYVSSRANPLSDGFALEGIGLAARNLRRVVRDGSDRNGREAMALAALLSGLALTSAGLGAVHGFAAPIGGRFPVSHGAVCAALLAPVMQITIRGARSRGTAPGTVERYRRVARILTQNPSAEPEEGPLWVRELAGDLGVAGLARHGVGTGDADALCRQAALSNSMKAHPFVLEPAELAEILERAG